MTTAILRPCLTCGKPTGYGSRCEPCEAARLRAYIAGAEATTSASPTPGSYDDERPSKDQPWCTHRTGCYRRPGA